jgi:hypothetical protein
MISAALVVLIGHNRALEGTPLAARTADDIVSANRSGLAS